MVLLSIEEFTELVATLQRLGKLRIKCGKVFTLIKGVDGSYEEVSLQVILSKV